MSTCLYYMEMFLPKSIAFFFVLISDACIFFLSLENCFFRDFSLCCHFSFIAEEVYFRKKRKYFCQTAFSVNQSHLVNVTFDNNTATDLMRTAWNVYNFFHRSCSKDFCAYMRYFHRFRFGLQTKTFTFLNFTVIRLYHVLLFNISRFG